LVFEFAYRTVIIVACAGWESGKPVFGFPLFHAVYALGGGNVKISPFLRDFQGVVGSVGNLGLVFHAFHHSVISTASRLA
jgi:hypothetical protein